MVNIADEDKSLEGLSRMASASENVSIATQDTAQNLDSMMNKMLDEVNKFTI